MSVTFSNYVLFGYMLPYEEANKIINVKYPNGDYYEPEFKKKNFGCEIIVDGMSGKYIFFGKILAQKSEYDGDMFYPPYIIDSSNLDYISIKGAVINMFGSEFCKEFNIGAPKHMILTHWS